MVGRPHVWGVGRNRVVDERRRAEVRAALVHERDFRDTLGEVVGGSVGRAHAREIHVARARRADARCARDGALRRGQVRAAHDEVRDTRHADRDAVQHGRRRDLEFDGRNVAPQVGAPILAALRRGRRDVGGGDIAEYSRRSCKSNDHAGGRPVDGHRDAERGSARRLDLDVGYARAGGRRFPCEVAKQNVARSGGNGPRHADEKRPRLGLDQLRKLVLRRRRQVDVTRGESRGRGERCPLRGGRDARVRRGHGHGTGVGGRDLGGRQRGALGQNEDSRRQGDAGESIHGNSLRGVGSVGVAEKVKVHCVAVAFGPRADRRPAHPARREGQSRRCARTCP